MMNSLVKGVGPTREVSMVASSTSLFGGVMVMLAVVATLTTTWAAL